MKARPESLPCGLAVPQAIPQRLQARGIFTHRHSNLCLCTPALGSALLHLPLRPHVPRQLVSSMLAPGGLPDAPTAGPGTPHPTPVFSRFYLLTVS